MDNRSILYGMPMKPAHVDVDLEKSFASFLRDKGYLVLAPSDNSPVAELVRAACAYDGFPLARVGVFTVEAEQLLRAAVDVPEDPAVRAWVERGRK